MGVASVLNFSLSFCSSLNCYFFFFPSSIARQITIIDYVLRSMIVMRSHGPVASEPVSSSAPQFILVSENCFSDVCLK